MEKLIEFRNIVKEFDGQIVLKGINLDIYKNEFVTLLGPSGCGKTTLLRILGGFLDCDEGSVIFNGEEISKTPAYHRPINTVFQKYALFPHLNVYENVAFGLKIKKVPNDLIEPKVNRMIGLVGLDGFQNKDVTLLSGGQQQRVAIARVLMQNPKIILADEPTASLDPQTSVRVMNDLKMLNEKYGMTVVANLHSIELAQQFGERVIGIRAGQVVYDGKMKDTPKSVFTDIYNGGDGSEEAE